MSETSEIKCDGCGKVNINYTGNCEDWYLQLANIGCAPWFAKEGKRGGAVTSMALAPPIDHTAHFCCVSCLAKWLGDSYPRAMEGYEKMIKHREWLAARAAPPQS